MTSVQENKNELEAAVRYCESAISRANATIESREFRQQAASKAWHEETGREKSLLKELEIITAKHDWMKDYADKLLDENLDLEERNDSLVATIQRHKEERNTNMALMTDELEELRGIIDRMGDDSTGDSVTIKQLRDEIATLKDQLAEREDKWDQAMLENAKLNDRLMISTKEVGQLQSEVDELSKAYKDSTHEEVTMKKAWREQRELVALRDDQIAMLERRLAKYTGEKVYPFKEGDLYYVLNQLDGTWIESVWDDESESLHDSTSVPDHPHKVYFTIDQKNVLDKFKPEDD